MDHGSEATREVSYIMPSLPSSALHDSATAVLRAHMDRVLTAELAMRRAALYGGDKGPRGEDTGRMSKGEHGDPTAAQGTTHNPYRAWITRLDDVAAILSWMVRESERLMPPTPIAVCAGCREPIGDRGSHKRDGKLYHVQGGCYLRSVRRDNADNSVAH